MVVRVPFWAEALRTPVDGDTAIVGLMARHPGRGTTLWGQPYGSPLEAWLAAPFVAALGPTTEALRLFYFLLGLGLIPAAYGLGARARSAGGASRGGPRGLPAAVLPAALGAAAAALPGGCSWPAVALSFAWTGSAAAKAAHGACSRSRGALAGLALWTHLMSQGRGRGLLRVPVSRAPRGRRRSLAAALLALLLRAARPGGCAR